MVKVDQNKCIGCGLCAGQYPKIFQMNLDGKAEAISTQETIDAKDAAANCPVEAISLTK